MDLESLGPIHCRSNASSPHTPHHLQTNPPDTLPETLTSGRSDKVPCPLTDPAVSITFPAFRMIQSWNTAGSHPTTACHACRRTKMPPHGQTGLSSSHPMSQSGNMLASASSQSASTTSSHPVSGMTPSLLSAYSAGTKASVPTRSSPAARPPSDLPCRSPLVHSLHEPCRLCSDGHSQPRLLH